jgi:UDP-N-acetylglucosamine 2-epimerase (non-hydrolysing)
VDDSATLRGILSAISDVAKTFPVLFPVHPRTRKNVENFGLGKYFRTGHHPESGIVPLDPLGYLDFLCLNSNAALVLTDSGGVQEETTVLGVPCLTLRNNTERPSTVEHGTNQIVGVDPDRIRAAAQDVLAGRVRRGQCPPLWDGKAAQRIVKILVEGFQKSANA